MTTDFAKVDPRHVKVVLENDRVRVLRATLESFDRTATHLHPRGVGVFLTDFDLKNTEPTGKVEEVRGRVGDVAWFEPVLHTTENLSSRHMELVMVELKR